jgi:hypothetical protein
VQIWDAHTPLEETTRALDDAVRAGKVLYVGISDAPAWVVSRANTLVESRGLTPFTGLQVPYSLVQRDIERELLPMADALRRLDEASAISLGFPHDFTGSTREFVYGPVDRDVLSRTAAR